MDDLVRSYFNIYGCKVIQENFESIGEKRYNIIQENTENVREIIKKGSKEAGSKEKDLSRSQVGKLHKKTQAEIRNSLQKEDLDIVVSYLCDNGFASSYESAMNIMESMSDVWFESILDEKYVASMDPGGKGSDRRAKGGKRLKPMPDRYKYSEAGFDRRASRTSPSTRKRKEERRGSEGGFNA